MRLSSQWQFFIRPKKLVYIEKSSTRVLFDFNLLAVVFVTHINIIINVIAINP